MNKVVEVQKYIDEKSPQNLGDLFAHFKFDIDGIIIAAHLLEWDTKELITELSKKVYSENELMDRIDGLLDHDELFNLLIPKTTQAAIILLLNYQEKEKSKAIVNVVKENENYLSEIEQQKLFDGPVIFFASKIDLKKDYLTLIDQKIKELDIHFQEPIYKNFFSHFELVPFLTPDLESQNEFKDLLKTYQEDLLYPVITTHKATIQYNKIVYVFDTQFLKESILGLDTGVNFGKLKDSILEKIKDEATEELGENVVKFAITSAWGLGGLDIGIKAVKIFLMGLNDSINPLSPGQVNKDYVEFKDSGFDNVRDWFYDKIRSSLKEAMESSNLDSGSIDERFLNNAYQNFIKRYYNMISLVEKNADLSQNTHTDIFLAVYDAVNNYNIRINTSSF